jgi:hypothetical protein
MIDHEIEGELLLLLARLEVIPEELGVMGGLTDVRVNH